MQWNLWPQSPESLSVCSHQFSFLILFYTGISPEVPVLVSPVPAFLFSSCVQCPPLRGLGESFSVKHLFQPSFLLRHPQERHNYFLFARHLYSYVQRPRKSATSYVVLLKIFLKLLIYAMHISVLSNCIFLWLLSSFLLPSPSAFLLC